MGNKHLFKISIGGRHNKLCVMEATLFPTPYSSRADGWGMPRVPTETSLSWHICYEQPVLSSWLDFSSAWLASLPWLTHS